MARIARLTSSSKFARSSISIDLKPMKHQAVSLAHDEQNDVVYDCSDAGTGKTAVRIWGFAKRRKKNGGCAIVFAPRSLLRSAWANDFKKFAPHLKVSIATATNREKAFAEDADVYVTNHDAVKWVVKQKKGFLDKFTELIVDEPTAYKHHTSQRSRAMAKVAKHFQVKPKCHRAGMTATPNSNGICDIWHQIYILDGGKRLGSQFYGFRSSVCTPKQRGRDRNAVEWVDKDGAEEAVFGELSDIVIRHKIDDCTDIPPTYHHEVLYELPSGQRKAYDQLELAQLLVLIPDLVAAKLTGTQPKTTLTAVNAAAVATKLLQVCCIRHDTPVLTDRGWMPIQAVAVTDKVWDGQEWVTHKGSVLQGVTRVIKRHGVWMTPEHLVLTKAGWCDGESSERFDRADVRLPDRGEASRNDAEHIYPMRDVGMPLQLRQRSRAQESISPCAAPYTSPELRMPSRQHDPRDDQYCAVLQMGRHARTLLHPVMQGLQELGRTRNHGVSAMARFIPEFPSGHGADVQAWLDTGPRGQQRSIQPRELSMGDGQAASQQHSLQRVHRDTEGPNDCQASGRGVWDQAGDAARSTSPLRMDSGSRIEPVYDLIDCGPRTRFVVMDENGQPLIVHNSGAVYDNDGNSHLVDDGRYDLILDLVEAREHPLVFFSWKHQRDELVAKAKGRGLTHASIDGDASDLDRNRIVDEYQRGAYDVLFAHPKSAAHGLTLTKGTSIIWCGPIYDLELFEQGNKRQRRIGQTKKTEVVMVLAEDTIEEKVYDLLRGKDARMKNLLDLFNSLAQDTKLRKK